MKKKSSNNILYIVLFIFFLFFILFICLYKNINNSNCNYNNCNCNSNNTRTPSIHLAESPNFPPKNYDILNNSYAEPLRDDRIYNYNNFPNSLKIPINIPTQSHIDTNFRQIGILTRVSNNNNDKETILPLMGKPIITNRDKWNFYTMNDKNNMIKLPIVHKNKRATTEQGIDNLYEGDIVDVVGYSDKFKVSVYDNNVIKYIPYL